MNYSVIVNEKNGDPFWWGDAKGELHFISLEPTVLSVELLMAGGLTHKRLICTPIIEEPSHIICRPSQLETAREIVAATNNYEDEPTASVEDAPKRTTRRKR